MEMKEELLLKKKEIVRKFLNKGVLISSDLLDQLENETKLEEISESLRDSFTREDLLIINKENQEPLKNNNIKDLNWLELDKTKVISEKKNKDIKYDSCFNHTPKNKKEDEETPILESEQSSKKVKVIINHEANPKKRETQDFVKYFIKRYEALKGLLSNRRELQNILSIRRILSKKEKDNVGLIGLIKEISETRNGNFILTLEDNSGEIKVLVNKNKPPLIELLKTLVPDEVIGVVGVNGDKIVFANNILLPDIPLYTEFKKSPEEEYAIFLSDLHVGSKQFLPDEFNNFLNWINGEYGSEEQKEIAKKIKYIFISGDLVDGVGIYPNQEKELEIQDIYQQYSECARLLNKIPKHMELIICPGNHDAIRLAEPQPAMYKDIAAPLFEMSNVTMVSNPSVVNIGSSEDFEGFNVLLYHGYSFDYYVANINTIREQGGYDRADLIMKFLLQKRHLAPAHTSTLYIPDTEKDPLVISEVPDIFATGHIHKCSVSIYRNVNLICGSCWQGMTSFQEKVGHHPEPARVPVINLQTREVKVLNFSKGQT